MQTLKFAALCFTYKIKKNMSSNEYQKCADLVLDWYAKVGGLADFSLDDLKKFFIAEYEEYLEAEVNSKEEVKEACDVLWCAIAYQIKFSNLRDSNQIGHASFLVGFRNCWNFLDKAKEIFEENCIFDDFQAVYTSNMTKIYTEKPSEVDGLELREVVYEGQTFYHYRKDGKVQKGFKYEGAEL